MLYKILFETTNTIKSCYIWNTLSGMINAAQSVILLIVITRTNSLYDAGVFSIAYAIANLTLTVGKYGMRSFQATDIVERYSFNDYLVSRIVTCCCMFLLSAAYCVYGVSCLAYTHEKVVIVLLVCLWKMIDALEDVFHGQLQQKGHLDVAAKAISLRLILGLIAYIVFLCVTTSLVISTAMCCIFSLVAFLALTGIIRKNIHIQKNKFKSNSVKQLLVVNFPLCIGGFFSIYIGNAPKYAIDAYLSETLQACYNFIFMPVFVIGLLASFIFNPILTDLARAKAESNHSLFFKMIYRQIIVIACISVIIIFSAFLIGIPILTWIYDIKLNAYRLELCILLIGGSFLALVSLFSVIVTVLRKQKKLVLGYLIVAVLAKLLSPYLVVKYQIFGAACLYSCLMLALMVYFAVIVIFESKKEF